LRKRSFPLLRAVCQRLVKDPVGPLDLWVATREVRRSRILPIRCHGRGLGRRARDEVGRPLERGSGP
jgi:hypothetical protein